MKKKFINWSKEKGFNPWELGITILITIIVFLWGLFSYFLDDNLGVNRLGDFFAGIFTPIAFYWLIRGYMLQKQELQQNTKALEFQAEELKNTVEEYKQLVEINKDQLALYRQEIIKPNLKININVTYSRRAFRIKNTEREPYNIFFYNN